MLSADRGGDTDPGEFVSALVSTHDPGQAMRRGLPMRLLRLLSDPQATPRYRLVASAALSGLSSTLVLAIVNMAAQEIADGSHAGVDWLEAAAFVACILVYVVADIYLISHVSRDIEAALHTVRARLITLLRQADLQQIEKFGHARLYESITSASESISRNASYLAMTFRSAILVVAIMVYVGTISMVALLLVLAVIAVAGLKYISIARKVQARYADVMQAENQLFESTTDLFDGFKEVRLSSARSRDLGRAFERVSQAARDVGVDVQLAAFRQSIFGQVAFFFLLGVIVFVVPTYSATFSADIVKVTTAALFMISPLSAVIQSVTVLGSTEADAARMHELEQILIAMQEPQPEGEGAVLAESFERLEMNGITFAYPAEGDESPFSVGPIDLVVNRGEIVFVTGGNGAGKTTLVKLLAGLYTPDHGTIRWNRQPVTATTRQAYRERIAIVFSDYHLFQRLHGSSEIDLDYARELMAMMELDHLVGIDAERFSRIDLSAGQRKRLALIATLLEKQPLLVLDEWAADQDPRFRRRFYNELLPRLRAEGLTVVAITHDDAYFGAADRCLHLEQGRLAEVPGAGRGGEA